MNSNTLTEIFKTVTLMILTFVAIAALINLGIKEQSTNNLPRKEEITTTRQPSRHDDILAPSGMFPPGSPLYYFY
jgi:hypothetical protein